MFMNMLFAVQIMQDMSCSNWTLMELQSLFFSCFLSDFSLEHRFTRLTFTIYVIWLIGIG